MDVEFDGEKDRANREKHGISLAAAADMDMETALVIPDLRWDYGEARFRAIGPIAGRPPQPRLHHARWDAAGDFAAQGERTRKEAL